MADSKSFDLIVIGSGPGGYVAAIRAAQLGLRVACVEKEKDLGGTCLNVGCIPSKALLHASEFYWKMLHESAAWGIQTSATTFDFKAMMEKKQKIVLGFNQGIAHLFKKNKITHLAGEGHLMGPKAVEVNGQEYTAQNILLATGSEPTPLPFLPFDEESILSSTGVLRLKKIPKKMLVIGAGVIGVELGSVYQRLGSEVIFIEFMDRICPTLDEGLSKALHESLVRQKMAFHLSSKVIKGEKTAQGVRLTIEAAGAPLELEGEAVLISIGRRPYTKGLKLEAVGITPTARGFIPIDGYFRTSVPSIYAIGDLVDGPMLAHKASEEGVAAVEIIAGQKPLIDYLCIPNVVYTFPEVASVGFTEAEAKDAGLQFKIGQFPFKINSRAQCTGEDEGFVKIMAEASTEKIVGVHIIGPHASELIAEAALAIHKRSTLHDIIATSHAHPTLSEAIREAALAALGRAIHR